MRLANIWRECVFHSLAWVRGEGASDLFNSRYQQWCRDALPPEAWRPLEEDAPALSALAANAGVEGWALQLMAVCFDDVSSFLRGATRDVSAVEATHIADPDAHEAVVGLARRHPALVELFRADLALIARAFERSFPAAVTSMAAASLGGCDSWVTRARREVPALKWSSVELSLTLGPHGRAFGGAIVVGAQTLWNPSPAEDTVLYALHEHAVIEATRSLQGRPREEGASEDPRETHRRTERIALLALRSALEGGELAASHAQWLSGLALGGLLEAPPHDGDDARVAALSRRLRAK